jgi:microbial collagenase
MFLKRKSALLFGIISACYCVTSYAAGQMHEGHAHARQNEAPMPQYGQTLPPSAEQSRYQLPPTKNPRHDLLMRTAKSSPHAMPRAPKCKDMDSLASHSGNDLADYLVKLPDHECTYPLFALTSPQAATVYSSNNWRAVASRFTQEAAAYDASNRALVNLALYLRAGYYLAGSNAIPAPSATFTASLRAPIKQLAEGAVLYQPNPLADVTAGETIRLITNMQDEAYFLPSIKKLLVRYTNSAANPTAADRVKQADVTGAMTSALVVLYHGHSRPDAKPVLEADASYPIALNNFVVQNKAALIGSSAAHVLGDAYSEAFRFMRYAGLKDAVKPMVQHALASNQMTGSGNELWLAGAAAVKYYDEKNCGEYGTCTYQAAASNTVLKYSYTCSPTIRIKAQDMTVAQMQSACALMANEEGYFHSVLATNNTPVANDYNTTLEVVVFDDYNNYRKYARSLYHIDTNNGGMYLEGDPSNPQNQARFIAHEASWLRPTFSIWNLEHEYVHYLDGRFDMYGDFGDSTVKPTVWWMEGIAEYLSLRNNNQEAIDAARTGKYTLSQIFGNTYSMTDYVERAYNWGYMASRFMMEKHRSDVTAVVGKFRVGDYNGYQDYMNYIGQRYDAEFTAWAQTATTAAAPAPAPKR